MVFFRFPFHTGIQQLSFDNDVSVASSTIYQHIASYLGCTDFSLVYNGKALPRGESVPRDADILVAFSLPGGKGGFGSMLRAIGAQIEKTTNREACRDLSGRRLRDINEEQRLKKWISKESERETEKLRRRKERLERLKAQPRHHFNDFEYEKKLSEGPERVEESLNAGMEKRKSKRAAPEASCSSSRPKKKHLWLEEDISSDSEADVPASSTPDEGAGGSSSTSDSQNSGDSSNVNPVVATSPSSAESPVSEEEAPKETEEVPPPMEVDPPSSLPERASSAPATEELDTSPIDLMSFEGGPSSLEALGLERLKQALAQRGLKCGGRLQDRAQRLWAVRGLSPDQYPAHLLAKKQK